MLNPLSPRSSAMAAVALRKAVKKISSGAGFAVFVANIAVWTLAGLGALSAAGMMLIQPWVAPRMWAFGLSPESARALSAIGWALVLAWAAFEFSRSDWLKSRLSWRRPCRAVMVMAASGQYLMMDRFGQAMGGAGMGVAKPLALPALRLSDASVLEGRPWRAALDPLRAQLRLAVSSWRFFPLAMATSAWGFLSMMLAIAAIPIALVEAGALALAGKLKGLSPSALRQKGKAAMDALADESAADLAAAEARSLARQAPATAATAKDKSGPRQGL